MALRRRRSVRERIARQAQHRCEYCLGPESHSLSAVALEHIAPLAEGGPDEESNLAYSCGGCNGYKARATHAPDPQTGEAALYHPRQDRWSDHFAGSEDGQELVGLTPTGRATMVRLRLNRPEVVNLGKSLRAQDA